MARSLTLAVLLLQLPMLWLLWAERRGSERAGARLERLESALGRDVQAEAA